MTERDLQLTRLVAEHVLGWSDFEELEAVGADPPEVFLHGCFMPDWEPEEVPNYAGSRCDALEVVEHLAESERHGGTRLIELRHFPQRERWQCILTCGEMSYSRSSNTLPGAICYTALDWAGVKVPEELT